MTLKELHDRVIQSMAMGEPMDTDMPLVFFNPSSGEDVEIVGVELTLNGQLRLLD